MLTPNATGTSKPSTSNELADQASRSDQPLSEQEASASAATEARTELPTGAEERAEHTESRARHG